MLNAARIRSTCLTLTVPHKICAATWTNVPLFTESKATRHPTTVVSDPSHNPHKHYCQIKMGNVKCRTLYKSEKGKTCTWVYNILLYECIYCSQDLTIYTGNNNLLTEKMLWWCQLTSQDTSSFPTKELNLMAVSLHAIPPVLVSAAWLVYPETIKAPLKWHVIGNKTQVNHNKCNKRKCTNEEHMQRVSGLGYQRRTHMTKTQNSNDHDVYTGGILFNTAKYIVHSFL